MKLNEKYKFTENTKEHSSILDKKKKVFDIMRDLNLLNISKNNTLYNFDNKMINKTKRTTKKSNNNSQNKYKMGIKLNKIKKDIINLKNNNLFNKYFKLNNKRYFKNIKGNSNENNYRNDNLNYDFNCDTSNHYKKNNKNKYKYIETINTDLDKNILNFRYPSVNINNMNYNLNLNLYTPSLYLSTLNTDHSIKNSKIKYDYKNFNKNAENELKNNNNKSNNKYNKNKKDKLFNKIKIKESKEKKEKKENDILTSLNQKLMYQTHNNSIFNEKSFLNKNFDNDIPKNDTNENININNHNNVHSKEHKKTKRIKGIKKLDFGFDLLNLIKQKDKGDLAYNNENKKKILNIEFDYRKIRSPTNISEKNNLLVSCDNKIRYEYNDFNDKPSLNLGKKKYNKIKIINNKNNNVLNSLIKDFIHFNNLNHKPYCTIDVNDIKLKNNKSLSGKPIM